METRIPPSETRYDDLVGVVSINLEDKQTFNDFGADIAGYNPERFEAVALRVYIEACPIVTLYAIDKAKMDERSDSGKLLVHKFKKEMCFEDLFSKIKQLNFTVTSGDYNIEDMEVVNK